MERKAVPGSAKPGPHPQPRSRSGGKTSSRGPQAASALQAARGGGGRAGDLLTLQRAVGNRAVLQLMPARTPGPRDSDMAGGGAKEKLGGSGHEATPTPGDGRNHAEMKADVAAAVEEAQAHVDHPESTVTRVEQALPEIRDRHGLRSLELESRGSETHAVVGKLNPKKEGEESFLGGGFGFGFGADSDEESEEDEADRPGMSAELRALKERERKAAADRKADKARRGGLAAERERAAAERQRIDDAKPRQQHYVYPSEMTGDIWHAAAAMILDPTAQVHFTSPRDTVTHEYADSMHATNATDQAEIDRLTAVHEVEIRRRVEAVTRLRHLVQAPRNPDRARHRKEFKTATRQRDQARAALAADPEIAKLKQNIESRVRNIAHVPKDRAKWIKNRASNERTLGDLGVGGRSHHELVPGSYRTGNVEAHGKHQLEAHFADDPHTKHVVRSQKDTTRAIMDAVGPGGANKAAVVARLRQGMTGHADAAERKWVAARIKKIRARVKALRAASHKDDARLLMINRRTGHENPQHNTSDEQFQSITSLYGREHLGLGEAHADVHRLGTMGVATGAVPQAGDLDLYDARALPGEAPAATKRRTALLWARIADLQKEGLVHGLIGGRSGSMDIASFMGVNAYSWDEDKPGNVDHERLKMTAPSMMTVGHMSSDDAHDLNEGQVRDWIHTPHAAPVVPRAHVQAPVTPETLRAKLRGLDASIRQMNTGLQRAAKKQKPAIREQLRALRQKRTRLGQQLQALQS